MSFTIFTMVWGDHHLKLFKDGCYRSLNWPKNFSAIKDKAWFVYTKKEHFKEIEDIFKDFPGNLILNDIGENMFCHGVGGVKTSICTPGVILLNGLRRIIQYCLENKTKMLFAPPDTIFGDGTVDGLVAAGAQPQTAVCVAHPRVLPTLVEEIKYLGATEGPSDNSKLVSLFLKHPHATWTHAELDHEKNSSFMSGVLWKKIDAKLFQIQHRLPTTYFIDFTADDYNYWWGSAEFGDYDHRWPGENFIRQERMRFVGSSDACFIVEVTDHDKNLPPHVDAKSKIQQDAFYNWRHHNSINRQFLTYYRAE